MTTTTHNDSKFLPGEDYFTPSATNTRIKALRHYLEVGPFDYDALLVLTDTWNGIMTDGSTSHKHWIAKPQARSARAPNAAALQKTLASRLAPMLAPLKWLNYAEATDETELSMLNLSLAQAGYLPQASCDEAWTLFAEQALGPINDKCDLPLEAGKSRRLEDPRIGFHFHECDPCNYRASPFLDSLVREEEMIQSTARDYYESLSTAQKRLFLGDPSLFDEEIPGSTVDKPGLVVAKPSDGASAADTAAALARALEPLTRSVVEALATKKRKGKSEDDSDSEEEDKFERLTSFGSQSLRKGAKGKSLADLKLEADLTRIRNTQEERKVATKCEWSVALNMAVDEETLQLCNLAEIDEEKDKSLDLGQLARLKETEQFTVNLLRGLQEKIE